MTCTKADIPVENLFMIGVLAIDTTRDAIHIKAPRKPFVVTRAEALNLIAYTLTQADFRVADIEHAYRYWNVQTGDWFSVVADERRALLHFPNLVRGPVHMRDVLMVARKAGEWLLSLDECLTLCATLIHKMDLKPREIDAAIQADYEAPRGQETEEDMKKRLSRERLMS